MVKKKSRTSADRPRNWTFILYPDSASANWRKTLDELRIEWIESPLHDRDVDGDGEIKKAHYHILLLFDGHKSLEQVKEITKSLNATLPQKAASARGLVRYMAHLDNPDKWQYDRSAIIGHGGADPVEYLKATSSSRYMLIREMMAYVRERDITEMEDLLYYAGEERYDDWWPLLCDNSAYIMGELIKSRRHAKINQQNGIRRVM